MSAHSTIRNGLPQEGQVNFLPRRSSLKAWEAASRWFIEQLGDHPLIPLLADGLAELALPIQPFLVMHGISRLVLQCGDSAELSLKFHYGEPAGREDSAPPKGDHIFPDVCRFELVAFVLRNIPVRLPLTRLTCIPINKVLSVTFSVEIEEARENEIAIASQNTVGACLSRRKESR